MTENEIFLRKLYFELRLLKEHLDRDISKNNFLTVVEYVNDYNLYLQEMNKLSPNIVFEKIDPTIYQLSKKEEERIANLGIWNQYFGSILSTIAYRIDFWMLHLKNVLQIQDNLKEPIEDRKFDEKRVFIVHGRDELSKTQLARILERMKMEPVILHEQPNMGMTVVEKLEYYSKRIGYAFIILAPDDIGTLKEDFDIALKTLQANRIFDGNIFRPRTRQNVVFELGWFQGKLGRNRVGLLYRSNVDLPTDIKGMVYSEFKDSIEECYRDIIKELRAAGYKPAV